MFMAFLIICLIIFVSGIVKKVLDAYKARAYYPERAYEIDERLVAYINRNGGIKR